MIRLWAIFGTAAVALAALLISALTEIGWFWPAIVTSATAYAVWYFVLTDPDESDPSIEVDSELDTLPRDGSPIEAEYET
jgi:hypothetical protein